MWNDVVDLQAFYAASLGQWARQAIGQRLREIWPDLRGRQILGLGYAAPYLAAYRAEAARCIAAMPAGQGALPWPQGARSLTLLADETDLPFADRSFDRVLLVHGLEFGEPPNELLREIWRLLADDGRLLVVAPARRGLWSRSDRTPFGQGHPYSTSQLSRLLRDNMFTPLETSRALFIPPLRGRALLRTAVAWERVGMRLFPTFSGVIIVEAAKQIYPAAAQRPRRAARGAVVLNFPQPVASGLRSARSVERDDGLRR